MKIEDSKNRRTEKWKIWVIESDRFNEGRIYWLQNKNLSFIVFLNTCVYFSGLILQEVQTFGPTKVTENFEMKNHPKFFYL